MERDREFEKYLAQLGRILRKMVLHSEGAEDLEVALLFFHIGQMPKRKRKKQALEFRLTEADKQFLKNVGIQF